MTSLKVKMDCPYEGSLLIEISDGSDSVLIAASDIYDSLPSLIEALFRVSKGLDNSCVTWLCEPTEYEMWFSRKEETYCLTLIHYTDHRRQHPRIELLVEGTYDEIYLPFWKELYKLQRIPAEEFKRHWRRGFPIDEMERLSRPL